MIFESFLGIIYNMNLTTLDCTLRDGGYYNNWDFNEDLVNQYIEKIIESGIDIIEIGFRNFLNKTFLGAYAYSLDNHIKTKKNIRNIKIGVMSDASIFFSSNEKISDQVKKLYLPKKNSVISLVRIAVHFKDIDRCLEIVTTLKELGYEVGFNMMQTGGRKDEEIEKAVSLIASWNIVDVLYFADSLGNMTPNEVVKIVQIIKKNWKKEIGIHTHDNKGLAIKNTLAAIDNGVTWVDSTLKGMGRGAGNAKSEDLLIELDKLIPNKYYSEGLKKLSSDVFKKLYDKYNWGSSELYSLAADYNIHPTYIQEMVSDERYSDEQIRDIVEYMKNIPSTSYNQDTLDEIRVKSNSDKNGTWNAKNWCNGSDILLIGNGPSIKAYQNNIIDFIINNTLTILTINIQDTIPNKYINGIVSANKSRILMDSKFYSKLDIPLYMPKDLISDIPEKNMVIKKINDYGSRIVKNSFSISQKSCVIPFQLTAIYALALVTMGGAKKIYLAGFDGYEDNKLQNEMLSSLNLYKENPNSIELMSITPNSYGLNEKIKNDK